ncbi:MAG TPA: hypothetical protein VN375_04405, partial [Vicinamibacteria bacterium]|nr:hypothetical protein [Vicinamibacteria bacterium]
MRVSVASPVDSMSVEKDGHDNPAPPRALDIIDVTGGPAHANGGTRLALERVRIMSRDPLERWREP